MPKILSLALRPRTLSGLYGQESMVKAIRNQMAKRPPQAWLFHGPSGSGKTTTAGIIAVSYQCSHMQIWGDPCEECWKRRGEFSIHEINASSVSGVAELEQVVEMSRFRPTHDGKRIIILDEAQRISNAAQNMLLTPFENPPASTVWIICTTEPSKLLITLRRRCMTYQLKLLSFAGTENFLKRKAAQAKILLPLGPLLEQCNLLQVHAPAMLLMALEKYAAGATAEEAVAGTDESGIDSLRICKAVTSGDWKGVVDTLKEATPDSSRLIRASVSGWLVGCMKRDLNPRNQEKAALSLIELGNPPLEDGVILQWLWGVLWKVTQRYKIVR